MKKQNNKLQTLKITYTCGILEGGEQNVRGKS